MYNLVGFANGCFDLFHNGHRHFLRECADRCDRLYVGVNTDDSVRALKGEGRPIDDFATRCGRVFWSDCDVYTVRPYADEYAPFLLRELMPDVIFRGYDQDENTYGYRMMRIGHLPGFSTTKLIAERG